MLDSKKEFSFQDLVEKFQSEVNEILLPKFKGIKKTDRVVYFTYASFVDKENDCSKIGEISEREFKRALYFSLNGAYSKILNENNSYKGVISQTLITSTPQNYKTYENELDQIEIYLREGANLMLVLSDCNNNNILNTLIVYKKAEDSFVFYTFEGNSYRKINFAQFKNMIE